MFATRRLAPALGIGVVLAASGLGPREVLAFDKKHGQTVTFSTAPSLAPVVASAPALSYVPVPSITAAAPADITRGSTAGAAPAAPTVWVALPSTVYYVTTATTTEAPVPGGRLLDGAFRAAITQELQRRYVQEGGGTGLSERVQRLREYGATAYAALLGQSSEDLSPDQQRDLYRIVHDVVASNLGSEQGAGDRAPVRSFNPAVSTVVPVPTQPLFPVIPVQSVPHHRWFWKH